MEDTKLETYNGWYSEKQSKIMKKSFIYENLKGIKYVVTEVMKDDKKSNFDDAIFMGKMTTFVEVMPN